jgi:ketosteroid isomerase-like protein
MAEEDVEVVRRALEAFNEGDTVRVLELMDPDVELVPVRAVFEGITYRGHEGFKQFASDMAEDWEDFHPSSERFRDLGDGRVLVVGHFHALGKASGMEVETPGAWVTEVRDGKIVHVRFHADEAAALDALGFAF